mmetsp:Transcript_20767/g.71367  ORF Transcript_20767/g.71367 Transcript_20767/m.71367 type:complete len:252 (-) Transcript_20767:274-1029(-)
MKLLVARHVLRQARGGLLARVGRIQALHDARRRLGVEADDVGEAVCDVQHLKAQAKRVQRRGHLVRAPRQRAALQRELGRVALPRRARALHRVDKRLDAKHVGRHARGRAVAGLHDGALEHLRLLLHHGPQLLHEVALRLREALRLDNGALDHVLHGRLRAGLHIAALPGAGLGDGLRVALDGLGPLLCRGVGVDLGELDEGRRGLGVAGAPRVQRGRAEAEAAAPADAQADGRRADEEEDDAQKRGVADA